MTICLSITSTSTTVKLKMIEMRKLREILELELQYHRLSCNLTNQTDNKLGLQVSKFGYRTVLGITRYTHKPSELEVIVDHTLADQSYIIRRLRPDANNQSGMFTGTYRWFWLLVVFGWIITTLIFGIMGLMEVITPKKGVFGIIVIVILIALLWLFLLPRYQKRRIIGLKRFDKQVIAITTNRLIKLNEELSSTDILRCWSCFKMIDPEDNVCIHCGKTQKE